jgi:hypothetical protein
MAAVSGLLASQAGCSTMGGWLTWAVTCTVLSIPFPGSPAGGNACACWLGSKNSQHNITDVANTRI